MWVHWRVVVCCLVVWYEGLGWDGLYYTGVVEGGDLCVELIGLIGRVCHGVINKVGSEILVCVSICGFFVGVVIVSLMACVR